MRHTATNTLRAIIKIANPYIRGKCTTLTTMRTRESETFALGWADLLILFHVPQMSLVFGDQASRKASGRKLNVSLA